MRDFVVELRAQLVPEVKNLTARGISNGSQPLRALEEPPVSSANRMRYAGGALEGPAGRARRRTTAAARALAVPDRPGRRSSGTRRRSTASARPSRRLLRLRAGPRLPRPEGGEGERRAAAERRVPQHDGLLPRRRPALRADARRARAAGARPPLAGVRLRHRRPDAAVLELPLVRARPTRASCATPSSTSPAPRTRTRRPRRRSSGWPRSTWRRRARIGAERRRRSARSRTSSGSSPRASAGSSRTGSAAEPRHVEALQAFAERAYRRPLSTAERDGVAAFYRALRERGRAGPRGRRPRHGRQRPDVAPLLLPGRPARRGAGRPAAVGLRPGQPAELLPLVEHARRGAARPRRRRRPAPARGARGPGPADAPRRPRPRPGHGVRRQLARLPPVRGAQQRRPRPVPGVRRRAAAGRCSRSRSGSSSTWSANDRSVLEFLDGEHTFVNPALARHYGMPVPAGGPDDWVRVDDADRYGRGGLLPMAVFLTKNSPGLRTSPVKRGYWVVRRLLGEHIPAPPPNVPDLPDDEAKLGELTLREALARHRADKSCAGCHERFDAIGLAFEGYGPVGERRDHGPRRPARRHPRDVPRRRRGDRASRACAPTSREQRQEEFVENLCRKLLAYALGRSLHPVGRRDHRRHAHAAGRRRRPLRRPGRDDRHQPAVPEQAQSKATGGVIAMTDAPSRDMTGTGAVERASRRTFLRGAGVTMALPWLESVPVWGAAPVVGGVAAAPPEAVRRPVHGLRRQPRPLVGQGLRRRRWSWAGAWSRWRRCRPKINVVNGLFNKHATGVGIHPGQTGNILSGRRAPEGGRAEGRDQRRPGARPPPRRGDRPAEHGPRAASSRSPATTRRTSRWPTARTSPGRAPPRRCRWRSTRRWPSTACSTTAAAGGTGASSTASASEADGLSRQVSAGDRAKLDEYLTSVREVERRVVADAGREGGRPTAAPATGAARR